MQERLRREYGMDIIATYPSVVYRVTMTDGAVKEIDNPAFMPEPNYILKIEEPVTQFRPHMGAERLRVAERVLDREVILERDFSLHAFSKEQWMRWGRRGAPSLCADKLAVASLRRGFAPGLAAAKFEA